MDQFEAVRQLQVKCPDILEEFRTVLARHNMQDFDINSIEFLHIPTLAISTSPCPPGTKPSRRCVIRPGGRLHCYWECK